MEAISLAVLCPLIASSATFALSSALYRFRCCVINHSLQLLDTAILSYGPVQLLGDSIQDLRHLLCNETQCLKMPLRELTAEAKPA